MWRQVPALRKLTGRFRSEAAKPSAPECPTGKRRAWFHAVVLSSAILAWPSAEVEGAAFALRGETIYMSGRIVAADTLRLSGLIGRARVIVLESEGGLVAAASYMAQMIHRARLTTIVRGDCASACTIMFYAGARRELSGRLGFHSATDEVGTANYVAQMRRYGAPAEAVRWIKKTPASRITWLGESQ
jgi:hypothetical protein